jgi:hypothetical protein
MTTLYYSAAAMRVAYAAFSVCSFIGADSNCRLTSYLPWAAGGSSIVPGAEFTCSR